MIQKSFHRFHFGSQDSEINASLVLPLSEKDPGVLENKWAPRASGKSMVELGLQNCTCGRGTAWAGDPQDGSNPAWPLCCNSAHSAESDLVPGFKSHGSRPSQHKGHGSIARGYTILLAFMGVKARKAFLGRG
jgi:hypothetical protein